MSEELYNRKLADLQKHIPFMETMINQLKDPKWKPREAQLNKMESLYNMITDRNKKWKFETLMKCEEVILKLQSKVKANRPIFPNDSRKEQYMNPERPDNVTNTVNDIMNALKFNNARAKLNCEMSTPKSPSPVRDLMPQHAPKIIPFEATNEPIRKSTNIIDPNELSVTWNNEKQDRYVNERPDIYASAAKSLGVTQAPKVSIFDRLGPVVPDVPEKPLLSNADLEMLSAGDDFVVICQNDSQPEKQQSPTKPEKSLTDVNLKIPARIAPVPASKPKNVVNEVAPPVIKDSKKHSNSSSSSSNSSNTSKKVDKDEKKQPKQEAKSNSVKTVSQNNKQEKVVKPDIFGSCLSSIDNMILEDSKVKKDKKKEERRHSSEHKKEKHHDSKHHHHHKHKDKDKRDEKTSKKDDSRQKADSKDKNNQNLPSEKQKDGGSEKKEIKLPLPPAIPPIINNSITENPEKPKRLADKYNPKPRKHLEGDAAGSETVNNFENRDPRRRGSASILGNPPSILGNPPSILGNPTFPQPVPPPALALSPALPVIPGLTNFLAPSAQQPTIPPNLMQLNLQPPQDYQSPPVQQIQPPWLGDNHQDFARPLFEPPQKHFDPRNRQFHQDNTERVSGDPRRQPRFSPPPHISPIQTTQFTPNTFASNIYPNQALRNDFIPPAVQRSHFEPPSVVQTNNRFEPPRFEPPQNQINPSRKSFCPFEPLDSERETQNHFSGVGENFRRNEPFRKNFGGYNSNRFERISDRYARKPSRDNLKQLGNREEKIKPQSVKPQEEIHSKSDSDLTHTKYDEIYSKLDVERDTFSSPLESLYVSSKAAVKSSIQSFKIPKKPKPEPPPQPTPVQPPPAPVVEESNIKSEIPEVKENLPSSKIEPTVVEESGSDEADDTPLFRRIRTRNKTQNKKNIIDDTDEEEKEESEEKRNEIEEEEVEEAQVESTNVTKRTKRQSAIIANKLIKNKTPLKPRRNPSQRRRERRKKMKLRLQMKNETPANIKTEDIPEEKPHTQDEDKNQIVETEVKKEEELVAAPLKDELKTVEEIDDNKEGLLVKEESKDADPVRKAKEELLNEAKKKNLNLNDQGADVLQFILMNYKKIKKIFKSDSSSEDESKEKKKKKKKKQRERTTSSSSSSSDDGDDGKKEKKKQTKEKVGSSDESDDKDNKKKKQTKEKGGSSDEDKKKKLDAKSKKEEPVEVPVPAPEVVEEKKEEELEEIEAPPKLAPKPAARKIRKIPARKNKFVQKKFQGRVTRNQALQASSPMRKTRRSELDKLHDDIKEMLMGSDLTSTGKRSCTIPKDDSEESKRGDSTEDTTTTTSLDQNSPVIPVRNASLRVLIEKTDIEKLLTKETQKIAEVAENNEDSPKLEKIQQTTTVVANRFNRKRILRKKKHRWASGIIKRKYKRKISNSEDVKDTPSSMGQRINDELHNKDYFVDGAKSACKLCAFKGKLIVQHYRSAHPHSEVLISRMDPQTTEHLIHEAKMNDYASILIENTPGVNKKLRYGFKCPFKCLIGTTVDTFENYYDHITGHTGEHRYFCPHCNFSTTNPRNLRAHMVHQHHANLEHHGKPRLPAPPASQYAFGFVCTVCNYVQTRRGRLESHIAKYHDNNAEIVKINLSLICKVHDDVPLNPSEMRSAKKQVHINECIESVVNGGGAVKTPEPALVKNLNIFELMSQIEAEEEEEEQPPVLVKMEPLDPEPELDALIPEIQLEEQQNLKPKDPDLTVFMCQSDLPMDDEQTIEKRRLKKMNEIQENCRSSRTSIVDKLQSRFENKALEVAAQNEVSPAARNSPISSPPPLIPLVTVDRSKKSLDSLPKSIVSTEVVMAPKKLAPISNIINRLQDKLLPSPTNGNNKPVFSSDSSETPPSCLSPEKTVECNEAITDITIGPVSVAYQGRRDILYSCYIPFCVFTTADSTSYERHCKESHTDFVYNQSKCDYCQVKIDKEDDYVTMHDIYRHICTCHVDFFANARKTDEISPNVVTATDVGDANNSVAEVVTNVISQADDSPTGAKYPFKITNVTSLESDTNEDVESVVFPFVISNVSSGVESPPPAITSEKKLPEKSVEFSLPHEVPNLISQADNTSGPKFPFIITSVTSLAKKSTSTPPVTTVIVAPTLATPITLNATTIVSDSFLVSSIPATSTMQTASIVQPYTMASIQPSSIMGTSNTGGVVPIILNPLLATGKSKMQLPVISRVQSLASPKKDLIRPVPLNQLKSTPATLSVSGTVEKKGMINSVTLVNGEGNTIVLKDIALTMAERAELPKSKLTGKAMLTLDSVAKFYKCPQYFCTFASDRVNDLVNHLKIHGKLFNTYVRCLYCDYKTLYETYVLHLEVHHSNCEYACGRCFYRATNAAFVLAHNRVAHKDELIIIKTARENMPARINPQKLIPIKSILKHYICGVKGCNFKTIFTDVFAEHLRISHASNVRNVCHYCGGPQGGRLNHWAAHGVHPFHCRYCPVGSYSIEVVVNHQSLIHSKMDYCIISRKFVPNPNCPERSPHSYTVEEDATYDRLYMMYGGVSTASNIPTFTIDNTTQESLSWNTTTTSTANTHLDTDSVLEVDLASGNSQDDTPSIAEIPAITNTEESGITADEPEITIVEDNLDSAVKDPLSLDAADNTGNASDGFDSNDDKEQDGESGRYDPTATKHNEEYTGAMLYKCICYMGFEDKIKFKAHLVACQGDKEYKCAHCGVVRKSPRTLLTHMNIHGRKRFKCSLCQYKHFNKRFVRDHLNVDHNVHEMMVLPATVSKKIDYNKDDFVLRPKLSPLKRIGSMASVAEQLGSTKTVFSPREMDQLPRPPIYQTEVFCAVCNYATKVKSNMVRHLQAHQNDKAVPESAPVNPVPCLEKSEKMFDKMVNLALSSHSGGKMATPKTEKGEENRVPNFVPINKRWVCGAESCNYLCPEEGMLRRHLTTFHSQESNYTCLHCNSKLFDDKVISVDAILKHLKLHDNHLYGCSLCKFIHNLKHKVERHLSDKHPEKPASFVVFREIGKEVAETETTGSQIEKEESKKEWRCGMCKYRTTTIEDVKIHTQSKHNVNSKNKCALCEFGSEDVGSFGKHFELNHSGQSVDMVVAYYKEDEIKQQKQDTDAEFNTTPLWQRNKNIKHIRGILLEETNNKVGKTVGTKKAKTLKSKKLELAREELNINKKDNLMPKQSTIVSEMILPLNKPSESPKQLTLDADPILPVEVKKGVGPMTSDLISPGVEPKLLDKLTSDPILLPNKSSDIVNKPGPKSLIIISKANKGPETKKPGLRRRRCKLIVKKSSGTNKTTVPKKPIQKDTDDTDDDVILLEDISQPEIINVDEIQEKEKIEEKTTKSKQGIIVLSDHKLDTSTMEKKDMVIDLDLDVPDVTSAPKASEELSLMCTERIEGIDRSSKKSDIFATLTPIPIKVPAKGPTASKSDIIEKIPDKEEKISKKDQGSPPAEASKSFISFTANDVIELSTSDDTSESHKEDTSTEKIDKSITEVLESCKLTFDDSSEDENVDILELSKEGPIKSLFPCVSDDKEEVSVDKNLVLIVEDSPSILEDEVVLPEDKSSLLKDKPSMARDKSCMMLRDEAWMPESKTSLLKDKPSMVRGKSSMMLEDKPLLLRDKPSLMRDKSSTLEDIAWIAEDDPSLLKDKPLTMKDKSPTAEDKPSMLKDKSLVPEDKPSLPKDTPSIVRDKSSKLEDKPSLLKNKPSKLKNTSLITIDESSMLKDKPSLLEDKPSKLKNKSLKLIDEFSTLKDKILMLEDKPSKLKNKPTMMKDKSSKVKDKASMLEDKSSKLKNKPTMMKDKSSKLEDKPSTLKDKPLMYAKDKSLLREKTPSMSRSTALERENAPSILENTHPLLENSNSSSKSTPSMSENTPSSLKNTASMLENAPSLLENASSMLENTPLLEHSPSSLKNTHSVLENSPSPLENSPSMLENSPSLLENSPSLLESASLLENTRSLLKNTASALENTSLLLENTSSLKNANSSLENAPSSLRNTPSSSENTPSSLENARSSLESTPSSLESASSSMENTPSTNPPSVAKSPVSATQTPSSNVAKSPTVRTDKETTSPDKREAKNENPFDEDDIPLKKIKLDMSIKEIEKMSKNDLLEGNFVGTYGPYGVPWNGNYMCPLCEKFVTVSNKEFTMHVYQELQYGSYKCTACDFRDSTESTVVKHHTDTHKDVDTAERAILSPDQQIIDWVEKLIVFQTRILTLEKEELSDVLFYCYFCDHKCVNPSDMRKHQVRHWTVQPYACNVCNFKAVYRVVLENHIKRCHPRVNATIKETDLGGEVIIKRIRLSARADKSEESTDQYETWEIDCDVGFDAEHLKDVLLGCGYCTHWQKLPELRKHIKERHPNENFKAYRYRCNFCASTFVSTFTLDQHFISCHSGMRRCFSEVSETLRTYSCPECHVSDDKLINIKEHLRTHFKMIKCMYCNLKVVYWKSMRKHYREHHRNENFEFVFLISQERLYEQAVNNITTNAVRNGNSASSSTTVNSNKKRKHSDEDLDDFEKPSKSVKIKQVARKSTGGYHRKSEGRSSSYSTKQQNPIDLNNVMTTIDVMGASVTMNIVQLSKILNINPVVVIEDCETHP